MINDENKETIRKLSVELKKVQNYRKYLYNISGNFLDKMSQWGWNSEIDWNKSITYIDYLNIQQLKKEIDDLDNQGKKIVREMYNNGWARC